MCVLVDMYVGVHGGLELTEVLEGTTPSKVKRTARHEHYCFLLSHLFVPRV